MILLGVVVCVFSLLSFTQIHLSKLWRLHEWYSAVLVQCHGTVSCLNNQSLHAFVVLTGFAETLIFSHRVSGANVASEFFTSTAEALNASGNIAAVVHKYSNLMNLEKFRDQGTHRARTGRV